MKRHEFLRSLHEIVHPRSYLEIGVNDGRSLAMSRVPSIAIDPDFKVTVEVRCDVHLARSTSDDFFARPDPLAHLPERSVDLGFIDGMHLAEFALRDFMNVERYSLWTSVVVFDDALPRSVDEAARDRHTVEWAGDVYKVLDVLRRRRPDLVCLTVDTEPTGVLLVVGLDRDNDVLHRQYHEVVDELVSPDPQSVPEEILHRVGSAAPDAVLASEVWGRLVAARDDGAARDPAIYQPLAALAGTGPVAPVVVPAPRPWPPQSAASKQLAGSTAATAKRPATAPDRPPRSRLRRRTKRLLRRLAARL